MAEVGLTINDDKSSIVYIDTFEIQNVPTAVTFLGYDFKVRTLRNYKGELYRKCAPGASFTSGFESGQGAAPLVDLPVGGRASGSNPASPGFTATPNGWRQGYCFSPRNRL